MIHIKNILKAILLKGNKKMWICNGEYYLLMFTILRSDFKQNRGLLFWNASQEVSSIGAGLRLRDSDRLSQHVYSKGGVDVGFAQRSEFPAQQSRRSARHTRRRRAATFLRIECELTAKVGATSAAVIGSSAGTGMARPRKKRTAGCVAWGSAGGTEWKNHSSDPEEDQRSRRRTRQPGDV